MKERPQCHRGPLSSIDFKVMLQLYCLGASPRTSQNLCSLNLLTCKMGYINTCESALKVPKSHTQAMHYLIFISPQGTSSSDGTLASEGPACEDPRPRRTVGKAAFSAMKLAPPPAPIPCGSRSQSVQQPLETQLPRQMRPAPPQPLLFLCSTCGALRRRREVWGREPRPRAPRRPDTVLTTARNDHADRNTTADVC